MALLQKKGSVIDRRLKNLEKEMARLNSEIRSVSRKTKTPEHPPARGSVETRMTAPREEASKTNIEEEKGRPPKADADFHPRHEREKFVNYFSAGSFSELRPLRQDGNVLKNKAIMMAILAILAVIGVLFHIFGR
jgi:hypothetical protein